MWSSQTIWTIWTITSTLSTILKARLHGKTLPRDPDAPFDSNERTPTANCWPRHRYEECKIERSIHVWAFHFQRISAGSHVQFPWEEHYPGIRHLVAVTRPHRMVGWWNKRTNKQEQRFNFASTADIQDLELRPRDKSAFSQQAIFISNFSQFTSLS